MGSQRVRQDWATKTFHFTFTGKYCFKYSFKFKWTQSWASINKVFKIWTGLYVSDGMISEIPLQLTLQNLLADKYAWGWTWYTSAGTRVIPCSLTRNAPYESRFYSFTWWFIQSLFWNTRISVGHQFRCNVMPIRALFIVVQVLSRIWLFATPWIAAHQGPPSYTISWSLPKLMSTGLVMLSNDLIVCCPFSFCLQSLPALGSSPMSWTTQL